MLLVILCIKFCIIIKIIRKKKKYIGYNTLVLHWEKNNYIVPTNNLLLAENFNADIGGTCDISSGGNMTFTAPRIDLN